MPLRDLLRPQALGDLALMLNLAGKVGLAGVALVAARLPRQVGGATLLVAFVPTLAAALMHASSTLLVVNGQSPPPFGPWEWIGVIAPLALIVVAARWVATTDAGNVPG